MSDESAESSHFETFWQGILDDAEAIATEYQENGWDTHVLTPGDVTALYGMDKPYGLSVLVPGPEFELVESLLSECSFETVEVYSRTINTHVFLLVVERDPESETAVLIPLYYNYVTDSGLLDAAESDGEMRVHINALDADEKITFVHEDVSVFAPEAADR